MSSLPGPSLCDVIYCHRPGSPDIGAARGAEVCGDSKPGRKQAAPGAACWKKDRQPVRALVASSRLRRRDPGAGVGERRA
ncbi:MAG: hypothetical protein RBT06_06170 [Smithellaceae bacterium]|nr:hypothetical protein [Smithellaceae bacterium]